MRSLHLWPHFGVVEGVKVQIIRLLGVHRLNVHIPHRELAWPSGSDKGLRVEGFRVGARQPCVESAYDEWVPVENQTMSVYKSKHKLAATVMTVARWSGLVILSLSTGGRLRI